MSSSREPQNAKAAAPAADVSGPDPEPPAKAAGAATEEYPPGVVPAGQPAPEVAPEELPANGVWLKVAGSHTGLEIVGAEVTDEYRVFTPQQAALLKDAAVAQGVTLIDKSEEEAGGETSS